MASSSSGGTSPGSSSSNQHHIQPHYFPTPALDHAFSGIVAGAVATVCMNPLDLVKVQFQVDTSNRAKRFTGTTASAANTANTWQSIAKKAAGGDVIRDMSRALRAIVRRDGFTGLYRGLSPNVVGNSASWGLYFLWYTMIKEYMASDETTSVGEGGNTRKLSAGQHLLAASESGAITAMMTNPIWVVKTRMFTTTRSGQSIFPASTSQNIIPTPGHVGTSQAVQSGSAIKSAVPVADSTRYTGLIQGLRHIWRYEGWRGLYKGAGLALVGVSNGAIQFVCYEELKRWRMKVAQRKQFTNRNEEMTMAQNASIEEGEGEDIKLDNTEYIIMSGAAKLVAIGLTYPYQVIRSRIQVRPVHLSILNAN